MLGQPFEQRFGASRTALGNDRQPGLAGSRVPARLWSCSYVSEGSQEVPAGLFEIRFNVAKARCLPRSSVPIYCRKRRPHTRRRVVTHAAYYQQHAYYFLAAGVTLSLRIAPLCCGLGPGHYLTRTQQPTQSPDETVELVAGTTPLKLEDSSWARPRARNPRTR